jgi:8-oxo-dGTP diphosphatase
MTEVSGDAHAQSLRCAIHPLGALKTYRYVVILSFEGDLILLSRRRDRLTWETQGGHIEPHETPIDAARRELYEESGALEYDMTPLCDYFGYTETSSSNGMVFVAQIKRRGALPESEMGEARAFPALPDNLTYPHVTPALFACAIDNK